MKLYVMRHGEACSPTLCAGVVQPDQERELTAHGHEEAKTAGEWLASQVEKIDLVIVSPYVRAQQTWHEVAQHVAAEVIETSSEITPEGDAELFASSLLARLQIEPAEHVLLVSHMPFVCYLTAYLDRTVQPPLFPTAGIAQLDLEPLAMQGFWQGMHCQD
ncbi:phosphohistidine phosphatase SixA [Aliidiomarina haloalkalitolerans]|uniref:Phosphohistidine phosphatase SixA n=1 Tax=Aliidiomarina haloalkalitolerans TaxID=859059 RepID=A0A432VZ62_9GAMM|nr:phosphohistidine phosphatase SixA [Aliidiomarina haloalkalitolerans]RUO21951.1 phosphohistidine phosphatase SixA [Aliidiomarina haloalkalitolerans]